jgi:hypothetical protein
VPADRRGGGSSEGGVNRSPSAAKSKRNRPCRPQPDPAELARVEIDPVALHAEHSRQGGSVDEPPGWLLAKALRDLLCDQVSKLIVAKALRDLLCDQVSKLIVAKLLRDPLGDQVRQPLDLLGGELHA